MITLPDDCIETATQTNPMLRLRPEEAQALEEIVGPQEWPAFRAAAVLAVADLPGDTTGLGRVLLEAALEGLTPGHGAAIEVGDDARAYLIPRLSGLELRALQTGWPFGSQVIFQDDIFEFDPFDATTAPLYERHAAPPEAPTGSLAALLGDVQRREPVREYVAWIVYDGRWMVETVSASGMEILRLTSVNPNHPSWRRDYHRVARGRVLRFALRTVARVTQRKEKRQ